MSVYNWQWLALWVGTLQRSGINDVIRIFGTDERFFLSDTIGLMVLFRETLDVGIQGYVTA